MVASGKIAKVEHYNGSLDRIYAKASGNNWRRSLRKYAATENSRCYVKPTTRAGALGAYEKLLGSKGLSKYRKCCPPWVNETLKGTLPKAPSLAKLDRPLGNAAAGMLDGLVAKGEYEPGMPPAALTPSSPVSKRERDCEGKVCWTRMLMCVPTVSERIAKKLLDEYGSLPAIQKALQTPKTFKRIRLDERSCLGKDRIKKLVLYLTDSSAEEPPEQGGHTEVEP